MAGGSGRAQSGDFDLGRRLTIVSPHLDDGVLSLGATIERAVSSGAGVRVVTVFAGDPESDAPADDWDVRCGFSSRREATAARREEDRRACAVLGADPVWLPLERGAPDGEVRDALGAALRGEETVLVPGSPCTQEEHLQVARLVVAGRPAGRLGLYVDQPYAMWRLLGRTPWAGRRVPNLVGLALRSPRVRRLQRPELAEQLREIVPGDPEWTAQRSSRSERRAKRRAVRAYGSQLRAFGLLTPVGLELYEARFGGEGLAWVPDG